MKLWKHHTLHTGTNVHDLFGDGSFDLTENKYKLLTKFNYLVKIYMIKNLHATLDSFKHPFFFEIRSHIFGYSKIWLNVSFVSR